jgi:DtxR family Mn-dependent transcriptional regulator
MLSGKQSRDLTASHEHYLRAIFQVRTERGYARLADVARELEISPPTLSVGLKALEARRLVTHDDHRFLLLTAHGERLARAVHHRYTVICAFLRDLLGVPDALVNAEACRLEHDLSDTTADRLLDLVKMAREDAGARDFFTHRFAAYRRACRPGPGCAACDLECLSDEGARA